MIHIVITEKEFKFKFTGGISLKDILTLKEKYLQATGKDKLYESTERYFNTTEFFPSTKRFDNSITISLKQ